MGAAAAPIIGSGISAGAGLLGAGKASHAQQQSNDAAAGLYNQEKQAIQQLLSNYFSVAPTLEHDLLHFSDTQQPEIQQLSNTMGASDQSLLQSFRSQVGGVANPGALIGSLARDNRQNEMMNTQAMESNLVGQNLSALEALGSFVTAPMASSLGGLQSMGNTYANAAASGGNPWESAISGIGNFIGMLGPKSSSSQPQPSSGKLVSGGSDIYSGMNMPTIGWGQPGANTDPYSNVGSRFASGAVGQG